MKKLILTLAFALGAITSYACTNFIVTKGASTDGSVMVTYAADSHQLYGALYYTPKGKFKPGTMLRVEEWDTGKYLGDIAQIPQTYTTVGNMNEHSLIITETTYGGLSQLEDPNGKIDYGSLIYITLQRAKTAREAIKTIVELANTYGYASSGESFSIADADEAWIMELIGKGDSTNDPSRKGIVWVAYRIPDGYVSAHANQARITKIVKNDPENCLYSEDVISFARKEGLYEGTDEDFSFCDTYAPIDFGGMRGCEARVWSFFRSVTEGMDKYIDFAMGINPNNKMPLWVKPTEKVSPKRLFDAMRDHYEGTPMDMTTDIGAGGHGCPYRWRPMYFTVDGVEYCNERATATQQTGFWLCGQARKDKVGILWFGVDDAATSALTPIYVNTTEVPWCLSEKNGSMLKYSNSSLFWITNRVAQFAYLRYDLIGGKVREYVDNWENNMLKDVENIDKAIASASNAKKQAKIATLYTTTRAHMLFNKWVELDKYLMVKYIDGNVKGEDENGFIDNGNGKDIPGKIEQPGYNEKWKRAVAADNGKILEVVK